MARVIRLYFLALETHPFPEDGICIHHGIHLGVIGKFTVSMTRDHASAGTVIMVYSHEYEHKHQMRFSSRVFQVIRRELTIGSLSDVRQYWNGHHGSSGVSVVVKRPCPLPLVKAIGQYEMMPNVFKPSPDEKRRFRAFEQALSVAVNGLDNRERG